MSNKRYIKVGVVAIVFSVFLSIFGAGEYASASTQSIVEKWEFMGLYNCLKRSDGMNSPIATGESSELVADSVFNNQSGLQYMFTSGTSSQSHSMLSCTEIYKAALNSGLGGFSSSIRWGSSSAKELMISTGYDASNEDPYSAGDKGPAYFYISAHKYKCPLDINGNCKEEKDLGEAISDVIAAYENDDGTYSYYGGGTSDDGIKLNLTSGKTQLKVSLQYDDQQDAVVVDLSPTDLYATRDNIISKLNGRTLEAYSSTCWEWSWGCKYFYKFGVDADINEQIRVDETNKYTLSRNFSATSSISNLSGGKYSNSNDLLLTEDETYELYKGYIDQAFPDWKTRIDCDKGQDSAGKTEIHLKDNGEWKKYFINANDPARTDFLVQNPDITASLEDINYIIAWLNSHPATEFGTDEDCEVDEGVDMDDADTIIDNSVDGQTSEGDPSERCYEAAGVMGHILCPILSAISQFTDAIYNYVENNFLMINASEMTGAEVRSAWGIVRDVANVAFVIVLLLVIFSQVTGIGIDNYGIKRILPRLIVTAVLVNVSFLICQVFVDISNILGVNIKEFLDSAIPLKAGAIGSSGGAAGILGTVAAGGILTAVAFLNPGIILSLVTGIIGVVIALLFMFVILIARQIGVVLLIVLSPVAFICYMLPNTEKLFASWRKIFIALLMAYPICSLAMGGGTMVANILANTGDVSGNAVLLIGAMIVNVLPFFFIPTILKRSMAGLGNLGATLSGLGKSLGRGATGAMRNSTGYKALQGASAERKNRIKAGLDKEGNLTKIGKIKASIADSKFGKSMGYGKLQKARISSAEKTITEQALGTGQLVDNAVAERYQNEVNAIKTQTVRSNLVNNLGDEGNYDWATADSRSMYYDENGNLKNTMAAQLYQYALDGNETGMAAITEQLSEKGHHGQEAVRQVMSQLQKDQASNPNAGRSIQSIAKTIMNNGKMAADYKSGARSSYDYMTKAAAGEGMVNGNFETNINDLTKNVIKASNYSQESFAKMDNEELVRISKALDSGVISGKDAKTIRELAATALDNDLLTGGTKGKNAKVMNQIAGRSIEPGVVRGDGEGI